MYRQHIISLPGYLKILSIDRLNIKKHDDESDEARYLVGGKMSPCHVEVSFNN